MSSGFRLNGKISRDGTLNLDLSEHFAQYNAADVPVLWGRNIHFANLLSLMHVRLGALITSVDNPVLSGDEGSNRKSITSHLSILIWWIRFVTGGGEVPQNDAARESGILNKQYARFFIPTSKLIIRISRDL